MKNHGIVFLWLFCGGNNVIQDWVSSKKCLRSIWEGITQTMPDSLHVVTEGSVPGCTGPGLCQLPSSSSMTMWVSSSLFLLSCISSVKQDWYIEMFLRALCLWTSLTSLIAYEITWWPLYHQIFKNTALWELMISLTSRKDFQAFSILLLWFLRQVQKGPDGITMGLLGTVGGDIGLFSGDTK